MVVVRRFDWASIFEMAFRYFVWRLSAARLKPSRMESIFWKAGRRVSGIWTTFRRMESTSKFRDVEANFCARESAFICPKVREDIPQKSGMMKRAFTGRKVYF